ncbi:MAG: ribonuclease HII [Deltaproteobacteria bacterium]|nr:ribonuclease HII [Deltaproteobacteria bacterium]
MDSFEREACRMGYRSVAGVDEAGRGPLAGPVVAAAVIFPVLPLQCGIKDSKKLSPRKREALVLDIYRSASSVGVGIAWPDEIDGINILRASLKAMERAVCSLSRPSCGGVKPDFLLIDGPHRIVALDIAQRPIVSGDTLSISVAAASIVAKTARDSIMRAYHSIMPGYNFLGNKGYPTGEHVSALETIGPSAIHRRSFSYGRKGS